MKILKAKKWYLSQRFKNHNEKQMQFHFLILPKKYQTVESHQLPSQTFPPKTLKAKEWYPNQRSKTRNNITSNRCNINMSIICNR